MQFEFAVQVRVDASTITLASNILEDSDVARVDDVVGIIDKSIVADDEP